MQLNKFEFLLNQGKSWQEVYILRYLKKRKDYFLQNGKIFNELKFK
jgi:hypothetical protein